MTVKDAVKVLRNVERLSIGFGDRAIPISADDDLMLGVYGNYVVDYIQADDEIKGFYEIGIAMVPVKEGN